MRSPSRKGSALQPASLVGSLCCDFGAAANLGTDPSFPDGAADLGVGAGETFSAGPEPTLAVDIGGPELELPAARIRSQHFDSAGGIADGFDH